MELTVTRDVFIDIDEIIENHVRTPKLPIPDLVEEYVNGLDDSDYYIIGTEEIDKIVAEVEKKIK